MFQQKPPALTEPAGARCALSFPRPPLQGDTKGEEADYVFELNIFLFFFYFSLMQKIKLLEYLIYTFLLN